MIRNTVKKSNALFEGAHRSATPDRVLFNLSLVDLQIRTIKVGFCTLLSVLKGNAALKIGFCSWYITLQKDIKWKVNINTKHLNHTESFFLPVLAPAQLEG